MNFLFRDAGEDMPVVRIICDNRIPLSRGMGSSAAAIAGGLVAANSLCTSQEYTVKDLLEMAATIEGHPDNVSASLLGGLIVSGMEIFVRKSSGVTILRGVFMIYLPILSMVWENTWKTPR